MESGLKLSYTLLGAALAIVFGALNPVQPAFATPAADKAYTVGNYPVDATAKDAVAAKEKALADGQQAAFRSLLKRIVPVTAYKSLDRLKAVKASDFVDGVAVRSEQNSPTQYIASLDFSFQGDAMRDLLSREGVPFVDEQAAKIVLVPVVREGTTFRAAGNAWSGAWTGLDLDNTVTPAKLDTLKSVVHSDTIGMLAGGDGSAYRILAGEYKTDLVVVAISEIDSGSKLVNVTLAGQDAVGPILWKRSYRIQDGDTGYAMELAAVVSLGVLEGRWKAIKSGGAPAAAGAANADVQLAVEFTSPDEWTDIRGRLLDMPGVDDVRVGVVSATSAEVSLKYPGGGQPLASAMAAQGMSLTNRGSFWSLSPRF